MTDQSDKRNRVQESDDSLAEGGSTFTKGSKNGPTKPDEKDDIDSPLTIEEREQLTLSPSRETVEEPSKPAKSIERTAPPTPSSTELSLQRVTDTVATRVRPQPPITDHTALITSHRIEVSQIPEELTGEVRLQERTHKVGGRLRPLHRHEIGITQSPDRVDSKSRPTTQTLVQNVGHQALLDEVEDVDPIFGWNGGHPYSSDRPTLILHCTEGNEDIQSFAFLQRTLRDTYSELRGGEPTVEQVNFVANQVQIPNIGGRIVTIDATDGEWKPSLDNGQPSIERGGVDIVSALTDQADTLYSGGLGYLLVNVPAEWESTFRRQNFIKKLVRELADAAPSTDDDSDGVFEKLRSAPITVARPRVTDPDGFAARVARYFGFETTAEYKTIAQIDEIIDIGLRSERWAKVALTERQSDGEESSRHYNWKALITEGIARDLWVATTDRDQPFDSFVRERILSDGPLHTEFSLGGNYDDENSAIADVYLEDSNAGWLPDQPRDYIDTELYSLPLAFEFETGYSEAAFGYRKLVESIEKYEIAGFDGTVIVVIPPRLLYRGERQARHLDRLIRIQGEQSDDICAELCVPTVSDRRCTGLQRASDLIRQLYDDD